MSETESDVFGGSRGGVAAKERCHALFVVTNGDDLSMPASRHALADVDVVVFKRGSRGVERDRVDAMDRLIVSIPDRVMSSDHGRLLRVQHRWMLETPDAKNGAVIAGVSSRCGMVEPGDTFELGHTMFLLDAAGDPGDAALDPSAPLASLHADLAAAHGALSLISASDVPILVHGETGTGKEVYVRAIHELSGRRGPLVAVNCGALSPSLLESELFGHRRGAFSGAISDRPGFVRAADGGTLFLDEIDELSHDAQIALLRVLQEGEVVPVGDSVPVRVDIRICAASQRPLVAQVDAGRLRSDLYARLLGYELALPPLRERACDLGALIHRLIAALAPRRNVTITPTAMRALVSYDWPRNIRELERYLASALVLARTGPLDLEHFPEVIRKVEAGRVPTRTEVVASAIEDRSPPTLDDDLRAQITAKLVEHRGNISAVARDLGKHREQIQRLLRRLGVDAGAFRR